MSKKKASESTRISSVATMYCCFYFVSFAKISPSHWTSRTCVCHDLIFVPKLFIASNRCRCLLCVFILSTCMWLWQKSYHTCYRYVWVCVLLVFVWVFSVSLCEFGCCVWPPVNMTKYDSIRKTHAISDRFKFKFMTSKPCSQFNSHFGFLYGFATFCFATLPNYRYFCFQQATLLWLIQYWN